MTLSSPPISRDGAQPADDLDRRLRAFFRAQMPHPWPSLKAPVGRPTTTRWPLMRSRLALAASVALLTGTLFVVAQAFQGRPVGTEGRLGVTGLTARVQDPVHSPTQPVLSAPPRFQITTVQLTMVRAPAGKAGSEMKAGTGDVVPGVAKPGAPAAVSVSATPMDGGRMKVTVEFYPEDEGRLQTLNLEGTSDEIDRQINAKAPAADRAMIQEAVQRIRLLNGEKDSDPAPPGGR